MALVCDGAEGRKGGIVEGVSAPPTQSGELRSGAPGDTPGPHLLIKERGQKKDKEGSRGRRDGLGEEEEQRWCSLRSPGRRKKSR